jgi:hypothetical protein
MAFTLPRNTHTRVATQIALTSLVRSGFLEAFQDHDDNNNYDFTAYRLMAPGQDWLVDNQDKLEMRLTKEPPGIADDDVPF